MTLTGFGAVTRNLCQSSAVPERPPATPVWAADFCLGEGVTQDQVRSFLGDSADYGGSLAPNIIQSPAHEYN